ncbi:MAG: hypothetical protein LM576_00880 [Thermofilum sp.]|nr:hypothetical protein [Thermofilum sp.]
MIRARGALAIIAVLLLAAPSFLAPLAYAGAQGEPLPTLDAVRGSALRYANAISGQRKTLPLLIPALGAKREATIGKGTLKADVFVLVFPATPGKEVAAADIISSAAVDFFKNLGNLKNPAEVLGGLYRTIYNKLVEAGATPAFIPYENMSFLVLAIIWIKPPDNIAEGLTEIITQLGLSTVKAAMDNVITIAIALESYALDTFKEEIREKINEKAEETISKLKDIVNSMFDKIAQEVEKSNLCACIKKEIFFGEEVCVAFSLKLDFSKNMEQLVNDVNDYIERTAIPELKENMQNILASKIKEGEKRVIDSTDKNLRGIYSGNMENRINQLINDIISGFKYDFSEKLKNKQITISLENIGIDPILYASASSCEEAKQQLRQQIYQARDKVLKTLGDFKTTLIENLLGAFDETVSSLDNTMKSFLLNMKSGIDETIGEAEEPVKKLVGELVGEAVGGAALATSGPVFIMYALGQGLFQALYTWIQRVEIKCSLDVSTLTSSGSTLNDERVLVIEADNQQSKVRFPDKGESMTTEGKPPAIDRLGSAAKGFVRGFLGTLASAIGLKKAVEQFIDAIPSFVVVNIKMEKREEGVTKYIVAQPKPGIYFMQMNLNIHTGADAVAKFGEGLMNALFGKLTENIYTKKMREYIDKAIAESKGKTDTATQFGLDITVPYLVLPPYFVTEEVEVRDGIATIKLAAVYDFAALWRPQLDRLRNNLFKLRYTAINVEQEIEKFVKDIGETWKSLICKVVDKVIDGAVSRNIERIKESQPLGGDILESIIKHFAEIIKSFIKSRIDEIITIIIERYLNEIINFVKSLVYRAVDYIDRGMDILYVVNQLIATSFTFLKVNVVNCGKMGVVALIPELGLASQPINDTGIAEVVVRLESLRGRGLSSLGAVPAFQRLDRDGRVGYVQVPGSIASLEPIVVPLAPATVIKDGKLLVRFVTPIRNDPWTSYSGISINVEFFADGKPIAAGWDKGSGYIINFEGNRSAGMITLRISQVSTKGGCSLGVAVLVPVADEIPVYVNPQALAGRA